MTPPRTCHCGYMMEWRSARGWGVATGAYWCAHCDLGCVGASNGCHQCKKMGVKL